VADTHDRRSFFKQLLRGAATTAQEVTEAFRDVQGFGDSGEQPDPYGLQLGSSFEQRPVPAGPAERTGTDDDLRQLAESYGIGGLAVDLIAHARPSIRMTRGDFSGRSRLGGAPDLPAGFEWPTWRGEELDFAGQIDLGDVAKLGFDTGLPPEGLLLLFLATSARPSGLRQEDRGGFRLVLADGELETAADRASLTEVPLAFSTELTLPSESAGLPPSLVLGGFELDAWQRVREGLAELQGVELEDRAVEWQSIHRIGGHPDTMEEGMHVDAQLAFNGIDLNTGERYYDPRVPDLERDAEQWRLLLQLSSDDEAGLQLGYPLGRLYVWIRKGDLAQARFDDVWAFIR
jgi:uncharacterized protein YwqG